MNRKEALAALGLGVDAGRDQIEAVIQEKKAQIAQRISSAPTAALREKYRRMAGRLEAISKVAFASAGKSAPQLSKTEFQDLPAATPRYTGGDRTREAPGRRSAPSPLAVGDVLLDRYEIRRFLGSGGMGAVYAAFDCVRGDSIAIKALLPELAANKEARERFLVEARLSSRLAHPGIVRVFDVQRSGELHFLTMEILEGRNLREEIEDRRKKRRRFSVEEALEITIPLFDALAYAHKDIIHRDLKPENIWLAQDGTVRLMDFGIARVVRGSSLTRTGSRLGTPYYMAPEQLTGTGEIDGRADQYSLAVVLYEMLSETVPAGRIEPLWRLRRDVPRWFSRSLDRALSASPQARYGSIYDWKRALERKGGLLASRRLGVAAATLAVALAVAGIVVAAKLDLLSGQERRSSAPSDQSAPDPAPTAVAPQTDDDMTAALEAQGRLRSLRAKIEEEGRRLEERVESDARKVEGLERSLRSARDASDQRRIAEDLASARVEVEVSTEVHDLAERTVFGVGLSNLDGKIAVVDHLVKAGRYDRAAEALAQAQRETGVLWSRLEAVDPVVRARRDLAAIERTWQSTSASLPEDISRAPLAREDRERGDASCASGELAGALESYRSSQTHLEWLLQNVIAIRDAAGARDRAREAWLVWQERFGRLAHSEAEEPADVSSAREKMSSGDDRWEASEFAAARAEFNGSRTLHEGLAGIADENLFAKTAQTKAQEARTKWESRLAESGGALGETPVGREALAKFEEGARTLAAEQPVEARSAYLAAWKLFGKAEAEAIDLEATRETCGKSRETWQKLAAGLSEGARARVAASDQADSAFDEAESLSRDGDYSSSMQRFLAAGEHFEKAIAEGRSLGSARETAVEAREEAIETRDQWQRSYEPIRALVATPPALATDADGLLSQADTEFASDEYARARVAFTSARQGYLRAIEWSGAISRAREAEKKALAAQETWNRTYATVKPGGFVEPREAIDGRDRLAAGKAALSAGDPAKALASHGEAAKLFVQARATVPPLPSGWTYVGKNAKNAHEARRPADSMIAIWVPAGEFLRGTAASDTVDEDETPERRIHLDGFWIDKFEVTWTQYLTFASATRRAAPVRPPYEDASQLDYPVVNVTWEEASAYARWAGSDLPTEAQWEKAARGTGGGTYPWGERSPLDDFKLANFCGTLVQKQSSNDTARLDGYKYTAPVGSFPAGASPCGALDMAGNASEWCRDWYAADALRTASARNPTGPSAGEKHVLRGGSFYSDVRGVTCTHRAGSEDAPGFNFGFRCVREVD